MSVRIGHASISENNTVNGEKGDQTTKEVCIREWYNKPWNILLRPKSAEKAEIMAQSCEKGCANQNIGYSQATRNTLKQEALKVNFDLSKVGLCNCDCSSFMTVCAESAGIAIPYNYNNAPTTRTMRTAFTSTGEFDLYTDNKYLNTTDNLRRGDILVAEGKHTVMVLDNGANATILNTQDVKNMGKPFAIDISKNQGNINFAELKKSGVSKIILRSTTKNGSVDEKWYEYLNACDKYQIPVECYKYSYATTISQSVNEAQQVINLLNGRKMLIWLDLENKEQRTAIGKQGITNIANAFINTCQNAGYQVGIYCNLDWYKNCIDESLKLGYNFWIARYPKIDIGIIVESLKPNVGEIMWQYTSKGRIRGINGDVDIDLICAPYNIIISQNGGNTCVTEGIKVNSTVNASSLNVRQQPTTVSSITYKLNHGEKVDIYGYFSGWYAIEKQLNEWVKCEYITTTKARVTASKLNYRQDAGTNANVLGQYNLNDIVNILNEKDYNDTKWYLCLGTKERFGWCSGKYLESI